MTTQNPAAEHYKAAATTVVNKIAELGRDMTGAPAATIAEIQTGLTNIVHWGDAGRELAERHQANLDIHPDGRRARAAEALEQHEQAIKSEAHRIESAATIAEAQFIVAATIVKDRATATADAEAALRFASDPAATFIDMLESDQSDDIVALLASEWGQRISKVIGVDEGTLSVATTIALGRLAESHDPVRKLAAARALSAKSLKSLIGQTSSLALMRLRD